MMPPDYAKDLKRRMLKYRLQRLADDAITYSIGALLVAAVLAVLVGLPYAVWHSSCRSAEIFNQTHGTHWTCSDFLWAENQINSGTITIH